MVSLYARGTIIHRDKDGVRKEIEPNTEFEIEDAKEARALLEADLAVRDPRDLGEPGEAAVRSAKEAEKPSGKKRQLQPGEQPSVVGADAETIRTAGDGASRTVVPPKRG
jgi:hypothetical protein